MTRAARGALARAGLAGAVLAALGLAAVSGAALAAGVPTRAGTSTGSVSATARGIAAAPTLTPGEAPRALPRYGRFEASADLAPVPANPFDPAQADVRAIFVDPRGREHRALAF